MDSVNNVPSYNQNSKKIKLLIPLSIVGLVLLVGLISSAFTYAIVSNNKKDNNNNSTVNTVSTTISTTETNTTIIPSSSAQITHTLTSVNSYQGWKEYHNDDFHISFMLPDQLYINNKLVNTAVNDISKKLECKIYFDYKVLKNMSYCDTKGNVMSTETYINDIPFLHIESLKGGPCEGASEISNKVNDKVSILGSVYDSVTLYNTKMQSCNVLALVSSPINPNKDFNKEYESKRIDLIDTSMNSKWNRIDISSIAQIQDKPYQYGLSDTTKLILQSMKYY